MQTSCLQRPQLLIVDSVLVYRSSIHSKNDDYRWLFMKVKSLLSHRCMTTDNACTMHSRKRERERERESTVKPHWSSIIVDRHRRQQKMYRFSIMMTIERGKQSVISNLRASTYHWNKQSTLWWTTETIATTIANN
jgi:hypothetical protein